MRRGRLSEERIIAVLQEADAGGASGSSHLRVVRPRPVAANQAWALDFVHDSVRSGRRLHALAVIDA